MVGKVLEERYRICEELGSGGFAQAYLAEDLRLPKKSKCVVKHLNPTNTDPLFRSKARELFDIEAETLQDLGKHDQIPQLYASIRADGERYLVLEFIDGHPINKDMSSGSTLSANLVAKLVFDVLEILQFVHSKGVIHRDIKPSNLIRRHSDGKIVLIDFGTVKQLEEEAIPEVGYESKGTLPIGTPGYMSMEQSHGKSSPNGDIFALGMVALQALSGMHPSQFLRGDFGNIEWRSHVEVEDQFGEIIDRMVSYNPKTRYQNVEQVLQDLEQLPSIRRNLPLQVFPSNSVIEYSRPEQSAIEFRSLPTYNPWQMVTALGVTAIAAFMALTIFKFSTVPTTEISRDSTSSPNSGTNPSGAATSSSSSLLNRNDKPKIPTGDINYNQLRSYLASDKPNWQAADTETYNQLLRLAGSDSYGDGTFHPDKLNNIQCADLTLIDQLWSEASGGNLGFKVQKKIYESEGKDWQKMYSKVGWRSLTGDWLIDTRYDRQKFRWEYLDGRLPRFENPPPGHLPFVFREQSAQSLARNAFLQRCF
jgi:serine/threonine protein kinase